MILLDWALVFAIYVALALIMIHLRTPVLTQSGKSTVGKEALADLRDTVDEVRQARDVRDALRSLRRRVEP